MVWFAKTLGAGKQFTLHILCNNITVITTTFIAWSTLHLAELCLITHHQRPMGRKTRHGAISNGKGDRAHCTCHITAGEHAGN